jgi:hypothetical protein
MPCLVNVRCATIAHRFVRLQQDGCPLSGPTRVCGVSDWQLGKSVVTHRQYACRPPRCAGIGSGHGARRHSAHPVPFRCGPASSADPTAPAGSDDGVGVVLQKLLGHLVERVASVSSIEGESPDDVERFARPLGGNGCGVEDGDA